MHIKNRRILEKYCYLNGKILNTKDACVSVADIGLLRGFGVFDFLRTYNGKPFLFDRHIKRFEKSAKLAGLRIPISRQEIENIIIKLLKQNRVSEAGVRIVLTGGESPDGLDWNEKTTTFFILVQEIHNHSKEMYEKGVKLISYNFAREKPEAKSNNYLTKLQLNSELTKKRAHEILYFKNDIVLEGATCNFFIFRGNTLITPKDDILIGTRRWLTLKLAKGLFKIEERPIKISELDKATEAFITSTTRDILPVTKIDQKKIGDGKVGKNTKILMNLYAKYIEKNK